MFGSSLIMREHTERALARLFIKQNNEQIEFLRSVESNSPSDFPEVQRLLAKTLGEAYLEILQPIFKRFPDMKPNSYP